MFAEAVRRTHNGESVSYLFSNVPYWKCAFLVHQLAYTTNSKKETTATVNGCIILDGIIIRLNYSYPFPVDVKKNSFFLQVAPKSTYY